ncbi:hypothetical protein JOC75_002170 [Metabacillus crassostreae]|uniref:hypothetical protein n=1 Tax=Metabacillus crassostreae TaxID=929098 RepID=UPI0019570C2F|nr:hypothetical protein [Metabacillus crassostreae]MBM7604197.1 hypothetical protein [Metabacillus crassostreae]
MFLTEVKLWDIVKKQTHYKLNANLSVFSSLLLIQVVGILLSTNGSGNTSMGFNGDSINISFLTGDLIIIFTIIWAFISAIIITTKAYRNDDFIFISNRLSSNLSNILFLILASIVGGVTSILSGILLKVILLFVLKNDYTLGTLISFQELLLGMFVSFLYIILFAAIGYFVGMVIQISKWFSILIPTLLIGNSIVSANQGKEEFLVAEVFRFFAQESSLLLFFAKVIFTSSILFFFSVILSNKMEVRK